MADELADCQRKVLELRSVEDENRELLEENRSLRSALNGLHIGFQKGCFYVTRAEPLRGRACVYLDNYRKVLGVTSRDEVEDTITTNDEESEK